VPREQRTEFYKTMRQDIDRLNSTINSVLSAAMYTDRPVSEPRPLDLARVVRRAVDLTVTRFQLPAEAVRCSTPASLDILGDVQALETVILNLLDNAVKYSKERMQIEVDVWADDQAHVRVRDHGIGMSRTHLPFIFTRFYRIGAEVRRSRTGTGLGLFIVRSIVKGHRGTISADSPGPDRGSTFTISLPLPVATSQGAGARQEAARV
jgi:two-component system sensor histidine kinase SenX3